MTTQCLRIAAAILTASLAGCASEPSAPREYLDTVTAATIDIVGKPIVFFHEHPERAVHMRDYVTVAAAAVDRQGKMEFVLITYFWTTFDAHASSVDSQPGPVSDPNGSTPTDAPGELRLAADDRTIPVSLMAHSAREAGIGEWAHAPPGKHFIVGVYRTDLATLRFVAAARRLELLPGANDSDSRFLLWDDQRRSLDLFVRQVSGTR